MQNVTIEKSGQAELPTAPAIESPRFPVRVRDSEQPILLRLDTRLLAQQRTITEANESPTPPAIESPRFPVRVRDSEQPILLRLDTRLLAEQRTITEANESILRRSQS